MNQLSSNSHSDGSAHEESKPLFFVPAGIAIVAATYGLARYSYGLFLPRIQDDLNLSIEVMGFVAGGAYLGYLLATLVGMSISATHGPRLPVVIGGLTATVGMVLIAMAPSLWLLATGVFLAGTSPGFAYPPLSDAVVRVIAQKRRERTYAWINSGTGFGVLFAGPVALWVGADWRVAWLVFAGFALIATICNGFLMPKGRYGGTDSKLPNFNFDLFTRKAARPLFTAAFFLGVFTSVYWTFAVDLMVMKSSLPENYAFAFWVLIGIAGIGGCMAGDVVNLFGLKTAYRGMMLAISVAITILPLFSIWTPLALLSGVLFGTTFIGITAILGIWSIHIYNDRPSAGFGATFFLISVGQLVGPIVAGVTAAQTGLATAFYISGLLCFAFSFLSPSHDVYSMTHYNKGH